MQTHNAASHGHVRSSCIFSFHVDSPTKIAGAIDFFTSDMYFQSWVCSSYCFDNVPGADTVGKQWNKSVYGGGREEPLLWRTGSHWGDNLQICIWLLTAETFLQYFRVLHI